MAQQEKVPSAKTGDLHLVPLDTHRRRVLTPASSHVTSKCTYMCYPPPSPQNTPPKIIKCNKKHQVRVTEDTCRIKVIPRAFIETVHVLSADIVSSVVGCQRTENGVIGNSAMCSALSPYSHSLPIEKVLSYGICP